MNKTANAKFSIKGWDETPYSEGADLPKMTRASVEKVFTGDLDAESHVEYTMMYRADGTATFVGLERVTGKLGGKSGSFVLERTGIFDGKQAIETYVVVFGSGTGQLKGLKGKGKSSVGHGNDLPFSLEYEL